MCLLGSIPHPVNTRFPHAKHGNRECVSACSLKYGFHRLYVCVYVCVCVCQASKLGMPEGARFDTFRLSSTRS